MAMLSFTRPLSLYLRTHTALATSTSSCLVFHLSLDFIIPQPSLHSLSLIRTPSSLSHLLPLSLYLVPSISMFYTLFYSFPLIFLSLSLFLSLPSLSIILPLPYLLISFSPLSASSPSLSPTPCISLTHTPTSLPPLRITYKSSFSLSLSIYPLSFFNLYLITLLHLFSPQPFFK